MAADGLVEGGGRVDSTQTVLAELDPAANKTGSAADGRVKPGYDGEPMPGQRRSWRKITIDGCLHPLEDRSDALAAADAHRDQRIASADPLQFV
jgi:hypothetical protein